MQAEMWSTQENCQELLFTFSHLAMTQLCTLRGPHMRSQFFNIRACLFCIPVFATHLTLMRLSDKQLCSAQAVVDIHFKLWSRNL